MNDAENLASMYMDAKEFVICAGYGAEVDWQSEIEFAYITEADFLREAAWVVLSAGLRETIVRRCFCGVSEAFLGWRDAHRIDSCREQCQNRAMAVFGNWQKIDAIGRIVSTVAKKGIDTIKEEIRLGVALLRRRPRRPLRAARQLLDPSKSWWGGGRRGRLADRRCYPVSVSLGVVPLVLARFVEVPVRIEVAAGS